MEMRKRRRSSIKLNVSAFTSRLDPLGRTSRSKEATSLNKDESISFLKRLTYPIDTP